MSKVSIRFFKAKLKQEGNEPGSVTTQMKLTVPDGKKRLAKVFPAIRANHFMEWFPYNETIDEKSQQKSYALFESSFMGNLEVVTIDTLQTPGGDVQ